jgi:cell shape-determining protein MreC
MVVAPISHPFARLGRLLVPARVAAEQRSADELARQLDDERTRRLRAERENERLRGTIEQLSRGAAVAPDVPVRQVMRQVVEPSARLMRVRIEDADGVTPNAVATASAVQLVGRVMRVDGRTCLVQPITAREAPRLRGEIALDESGAGGARLACLLAPGDDGVLRGEVEASDTPAGAGVDGSGAIRPGMTVRLSDDQWPRHAQMLIVGRVESIEPHERQPLRKVVTVRPTVDLRRLSEVVLRLPDTGSTGGTP